MAINGQYLIVYFVNNYLHQQNIVDKNKWHMKRYVSILNYKKMKCDK